MTPREIASHCWILSLSASRNGNSYIQELLQVVEKYRAFSKKAALDKFELPEQLKTAFKNKWPSLEFRLRNGRRTPFGTILFGFW